MLFNDANTQNINVLSPGDLLDDRGRLATCGYAFSQVKKYDRAAICGKRFRIKEWDYYCFGDENRAIALTVADNSYMSLASVSVLDFERLCYTTKSKIGLFSMGKLNMPPSADNGVVQFDKSGVKMRFESIDGKRTLICDYKDFGGKGVDFSCEVRLDANTDDNITVAIPFSKPKQFYYNTKINCLKGSGYYTLGNERHDFTHNAMGVLDFGRGVWPYKNVWYWSSLSTEVDGEPMGFNLGYGFGKPVASENVVFYKGKAHKLDDVKFIISYRGKTLDYLKPWKIIDNEGRLDLTFYPLIDRKDHMRAAVLKTDQHQVFGKFHGRATLDDGTIIEIRDRLGFAERVCNNW